MGRPSRWTGPQGNLVMIDLAEEGNTVAVRPSGTEPKVKFYLTSCMSRRNRLADLDRSKAEMEQTFGSTASGARRLR